MLARVALMGSLCLTILALGCRSNRYELAKDAQDRTVRVDRRTGVVAVVEGDSLIPLGERDTLEEKRLAAMSDSASQVHRWPLDSAPGIDSVFVRTRYDPDMSTVRYIVTAKPWPWDQISGMWLSFRDSAGFEIHRQELDETDFTRNYVNRRSPVTVAGSTQGSFFMPLQTYLRLIRDSGSVGIMTSSKP